MEQRRSYHHGDLRRSLIDHALTLIRENGADRLTLRGVASKAGVSHSASYRHFRNKEQLLAAVAERGFRSLATAVEVAATEGREAVDRFRDAGQAYVTFALDQPEEFRIMFGSTFDEKLHPCTVAAAKGAFEVLVKLALPCGSRYGAVTTARIAWAQVHGIAELILHQQLNLHTRREFQSLTKDAIDVLFNGMIA